MIPFRCPHCGATKNRVREVGAVATEENGPDRGFVFCNGCMTLIVWELDETQSARRATADETGTILASLVGQAAFLNSLQKHMKTRR